MKELAKELNQVVNTQRKINIEVCGENNLNIMIKGCFKNVKATVKELTYTGMKMISFTEPNPYNKKYIAIMTKSI